MMKLYLTTEGKHNRAGLYRCEIWTEKPELFGDVWEAPTPSLSFRVTGDDLAALGFPEPGEMRTIEIGENKEGE